MTGRDLTIRSVDIEQSTREFDVPFGLSTTTLRALTEVTAHVHVADDDGRTATGTSTGFLVTGWAFPDPAVRPAEKDRAMRLAVGALADRVTELEPGDPLCLGLALGAAVPEVVAEVTQATGLAAPLPDLAGAVCLAPIDAALWDAWGRLAGVSSLDGLDGDALGADLSAPLGDWARGHWPAELLTAPRDHLVVQHVVATADQLDGPDADPGHPPASLREWVARDRISSLKLKVDVHDPAATAERIAAAHEITCRTLGADDPAVVRIALDANEACHDLDGINDLLDLLESAHPAVRASIDTLEQPTPRGSAPDGLADLGRRVPVIADEDIAGIDDLDRLADEGWSGIAVKTGRGFSLALVSYCWARLRGMACVSQDLTVPGLGMVHAAVLTRRLALATDTFECNSRQYVPSANAAAAARWPEVFGAVDGRLDVTGLRGPGLT